jgi:hypothetical protein
MKKVFGNEFSINNLLWVRNSFIKYLIFNRNSLKSEEYPFKYEIKWLSIKIKLKRILMNWFLVIKSFQSNQ